MNKISFTLSFYFIRKFLFYLLSVYFVVSGIVLLLDTMELLRIMHAREIQLSTIMKMAFLKNLAHMQKIFAYICLISAILTFNNLNKSSELIVARALGLSVWQFVAPSLIIIFIIGVINMTIMNPIMTIMLRQYEKMEAHYLKGQTSLMALSPTGLWVIQHDPKTQERSIIHALRVYQDNSEIHDITFYYLTSEGTFAKRIDAEKAILKKNKWVIYNSTTSFVGNQEVKETKLEVPTNISFARIEESMIPPQTISFWNLTSFINMAESSGLSALRHKMYFYTIISSPILLIGLVLLGAYFSLNSIRHNNFQRSIVYGIAVGFILYFFSDLIFAMGISGKIDPALASFMPACLCLLVSMFLMFQKEE